MLETFVASSRVWISSVFTKVYSSCIFSVSVKKALTSSEKLKRLQFQESLALWEHVRKVYDEGNLLDEEYDDWKSAWPDFIDKDQMYGYTPNPEIANKLQKLQGENKTTAAPDSGAKAKRKRKPEKQDTD